MISGLSEKDYIITKIILAIGLIPFTFYMLEKDLLKSTLLDNLVGNQSLWVIFSVLAFFLTAAIISLALAFAELGKIHQEGFYKIFNLLFNFGVLLTGILFLAGFLSTLTNLITQSIQRTLITFLNQNLGIVIFTVLIIVLVIIYGVYFKGKEKEKTKESEQK